jgi:hypothetical protein
MVAEIHGLPRFAGLTGSVLVGRVSSASSTILLFPFPFPLLLLLLRVDASASGFATPLRQYTQLSAMGFFQEVIGTQIPLAQSRRWGLRPHCQSAGLSGFARSSDWVGLYVVMCNRLFEEAIVLLGSTFGRK